MSAESSFWQRLLAALARWDDTPPRVRRLVPALASDELKDLEDVRQDAQAFLRAKAIYEDALNQMERQMARMQNQASKLNADLVSERNTNTALYEQIRALQSQIRMLERQAIALRAQLAAAGHVPGAVPEAVGS